MNWIEPNTNIKFLKNVPLDLTYEHTLYWANKETQQEYFNSKVAYTLGKQSYQRANKGVMKVELRPEQLYNCNYLMFQNESFGSKWFYAFVVSSEYVNNHVSQVTYVIDIMQTWFFDYSLGQTFVERQHTVTDNPGENRIDEGINVGAYSAAGSVSVSADTTYTYSASNTSDGGAPIPKVIDGSPTNLYFSSNKDYETTLSELQNFNDSGYGDSIVSAYISTGSVTKSVSAPSRGDSVAGGYKPKNKKLLTFPYTKITVINPSCAKTDYTYEDSGNSEQPIFKYQSVQFPTPSWILYPEEYKNISDDIADGSPDSTTVSMGVSGDTFKAYMAQTTSYGTRTRLKDKVYSAVNTALSPLTSYHNTPIGEMSVIDPSTAHLAATAASGIVSYGASFFNYASNFIKNIASNNKVAAGDEILNKISSLISTNNEPDQILSSPGASSILYRLGMLGRYTILKETVIEQQARAIDDYFTRYGYALKRTATPNRNARPHWTYIKTQGCVIKGSCPADVERSICSIYDNGITFWNNPDEVGDYSLDNSPK